MNLKELSPLFLLLIIVVSGCSTQNPEPEPTPKAVYIILDGISAEVIEETDTPNIDKIAAGGGYSRATTGGIAGGYSESPTASAIGYNNVLTGTWANKHNVYDNDINNPNYEYWSLYRLIETVKPDLKTAIYSSWTDNRTKLVGAGLEESGNFEIDIVRDGYDLDTLSFAHDSAWVRKVDDKVSEEAATSLKEDSPDFSWVYLWYTDDTGHHFGETEEYFESVRNADREVGKIWDAIQEREKNFNEDWLIIVTTDHGRALPDGKGHGRQSQRERTVWFATNADNLNDYFQNEKVEHVDLYPTIARHLEIEIPQNVANELDGVPLIGSISLSNLSATRNGDKLNLEWTPWETEGDVEIKLASTNQYQTGGTDEYVSAGNAELSSGSTEIDLNSVFETAPDTVKVVVEGKENQHTIWSVKK